jgi:hypothetical protein
LPSSRSRSLSEPARRTWNRDGITKGREDATRNRQYDPDRHSWYRSADRGYNSRYGSRESYRTQYRAGFVAGYEDAHDGRNARTGRSRPWWWPF